MLLPELSYLAPKSKAELVACLADANGKAKILAGGTDIIPNMLNKLYQVETLIDIRQIEDLKGILQQESGGLRIGAATTMKALEESPLIAEHYRALHKSAMEVGSPQIRAMATIGGNICNASPAADTPPALVALSATAILAGKDGQREIPIETFIEGNRIVDLRPGEFLEALSLPAPRLKSTSRFGLITHRAAVEIDVASLAVHLALDDAGKVADVKIAMGSVAPVPLRARSAEQLLMGHLPDAILIEKAAEKCADESKPIDDVRGSAAYRRHLIKVLAVRMIRETLGAIAG